LFQGLGRSRQRRGERGERGEGADGGVEGEQGVAGADVGALLVVFGRESIRVSFLDFLFSVENKKKVKKEEEKKTLSLSLSHPKTGTLPRAAYRPWPAACGTAC
jgi:hypothetical protein